MSHSIARIELILPRGVWADVYARTSKLLVHPLRGRFLPYSVGKSLILSKRGNTGISYKQEFSWDFERS